MQQRLPLFCITLITFFFFPHKISCSFIISNNCPFTIWPGILASAGTPELATTGFELRSGMSVKISNTPGWSGRMWARTGCQFDKTGSGTCRTGDCGGKLECKGSGATPPTSLFEITLGKGNIDKDFYDVSLVDGYNLPIVAWPLGVLGNQCNATGCLSDVNMGCPKELQVVGNEEESETGNNVVACKSACEAFGSDQYCCSGEYGNPNTCKPSPYSILFKKACPRAYSYAYDDMTSTFTCKASDYAILFCPTSNHRAKKPSGIYKSPPMPPPPPPTYSYPPPPTFSQASEPPPPPVYSYPSQTPPPPYKRHRNGASMGDVSSSLILRPILWLGILSLLD